MTTVRTINIDYNKRIFKRMHLLFENIVKDLAIIESKGYSVSDGLNRMNSM